MLEQIFAKVSTELIPEHLILPKILKNCCYLEPPQNTCFIDNPDLIYLFDILLDNRVTSELTTEMDCGHKS